jgi:hypothetical protein
MPFHIIFPSFWLQVKVIKALKNTLIDLEPNGAKSAYAYDPSMTMVIAHLDY